MDTGSVLGRLGGQGSGRHSEPIGRHRVVPTVAVAAAGLPFFLYVADFAAGGNLAIAADDAATRESREAEKTNETHDVLMMSKLCTAELAIEICEHCEGSPAGDISFRHQFG
jgi:hypothetical protein